VKEVVMTMNMEHTVNELGWMIAEHGIASCEPEVALVAWNAADSSLSPTLVSVLLDQSEPAVVRERAFGRLATQLISRPSVRQLTFV
jgi:hypothetical protein